MKITLFTSNKNRHNYLINLLSTISDELFVIQECDTIFPGVIPGRYQASPIMKKYFENVNNVEFKLFGNSYVNNLKKNIKILPMLSGDLNKCPIDLLSDFLKSDIYVAFGSSYIKGELIDFLVKQRAINIHAGVSPYYRGRDCNFWALFNNNPHLVGATIHMLSKGLDSGPILYHALSEIKEDPFIYTMSVVKSAFHSITQKIKNKSIFEHAPEIQDKSKEIKYSKKNQFNDEVIKKFLSNKIDLNSKAFKLDLYKNPYFLKNL